MSRFDLKLIPKEADVSLPSSHSFVNQLQDHHQILTGYLNTHLLRNHSEKTIQTERDFLTGWFEGLIIEDRSHPAGERQLLIWEAMKPVVGRQRVMEFTKGIIDVGLKPRTLMTYLGYLRRCFAYVESWPYIPGTPQIPIVEKYGRIEQPVLEYDYPVHVVDIEDEGFPPTGKQLLELYELIRVDYVGSQRKKMTAYRDYTMFVLTGESGLRADELLHLDSQGPHRDIFYERSRLQTRFGKGTKGSGKRVRKTILSPFAQVTLRQYESLIRPQFPNAKTEPALFLTEDGRRMTYRAAWSQLKRLVACARKHGADLPPRFGWHLLRKSFATNFIEKNPGSSWVLLDLLGHMSPSTLHRYVKHDRAYIEAALDNYVESLMGEHSAQKRKP